MRILVHPGFHKTGTTSVQYGLKAQAETLAPRLRVLMSEDFPRAVRAARRHTAQPAAGRLASYARGLAEAVNRLDPSDTRPLMISSEKLVGWIPGRKGNWHYDDTPLFMERVTQVLRDRFGPKAELTLWFTTRRPEDWQRSVYWQNLRAMRITEDFDSYRHRLDHAARLDEVVAATRAHLGGRARVLSSAIEEIGTAPLGPLGHALGLLGVSTEGLSPPTAFNVQPSGAAEELLALNRSSMSDDDVAAARHALFRAYLKKGQTRRKPGP